jgi:hypothetical protein
MIVRILLFSMRPTSVLHHGDVAFHLAIPVVTEVLHSEGRIEKSRICIDLVVVVSFGIVFSKNLPAIVQGNR